MVHERASMLRYTYSDCLVCFTLSRKRGSTSSLNDMPRQALIHNLTLGGRSSAPCSGTSTPKKTRYPLYRKLGGSGERSRRDGESHPTGIRTPGPSSPQQVATPATLSRPPPPYLPPLIKSWWISMQWHKQHAIRNNYATCSYVSQLR